MEPHADPEPDQLHTSVLLLTRDNMSENISVEFSMSEVVKSATFESRFLEKNLSSFLDPLVAIVELTANAYDAGATEVQISWPIGLDEAFSITDNGWGMSRSQFEARWSSVGYNRRQTQRGKVKVRQTGEDIVERKPFGRNGMGRISGFFLSNTYLVQSHDGKNFFEASVERSSNFFDLRIQSEGPSTSFGTTISTTSAKAPGYSSRDIIEELGSRFLADPTFSISVNGVAVNFDSTKSSSYIPATSVIFGTIPIWVLDQTTHRRQGIKGIRYIVSSRMVGKPDQLFDGRKITKTFVVDASALEEKVKEDWTAFQSDDALLSFKEAVHDHIRTYLDSEGELQISNQINSAIREQGQEIRSLTRAGKDRIFSLTQEMKKTKLNLSDDEVNWVIQTIVRIEESETAQELYRKISLMSEDEHQDMLSLLERFSPKAIRLVMDEIEARIKFLDSLEKILKTPGLDELHDLQPVIAQGLWIFGPEFDTPEFFSNVTLATLLAEEARRNAEVIDRPSIEVIPARNTRPDIVVLPSSCVSVHTTTTMENEEIVNNQALILELKSYQKQATTADKLQLTNYINSILHYGGIRAGGKIHGFLICRIPPLGDRSIRGGAEGINFEQTTLTFDELIRKAQRRLFGLRERLQAIEPPSEMDQLLDSAVVEETQPVLFSSGGIDPS